MNTTSRLLHPKIGHSHWSNVVLLRVREVTVRILGSSSLYRTRSSEFVSVGLISLPKRMSFVIKIIYRRSM